jgi:hypothetical protein
MSTPEPSPAKKPATKPAAASATTASAPVGGRKRVSRGLDITLTIVFLVLNVCMLVALFVPAIFLGFAYALIVPNLVFIVNLVLSIVFLVRKRTAWLLSLVLGLGGLLVFFLGILVLNLWFTYN